MEEPNIGTCEVCATFPIQLVPITIENEQVNVCAECASQMKVGHWSAR